MVWGGSAPLTWKVPYKPCPRKKMNYPRGHSVSHHTSSTVFVVLCKAISSIYKNYRYSNYKIWALDLSGTWRGK